MKQEEQAPVIDAIDNTETVVVVPGTDITIAQLEEYKKQFKKVFKTQFVDEVFVWHRLDRKTFSAIITETKGIEDGELRIETREKAFCEAAVLYPSAEVLKQIIADEDVLVTGLSEEILFKSGFVPPKTEQL